jgi:sugar/nucleoside kinase (ribokinase family)
MSPKYGVTAIGNAIVDILAPATDAFIAAQSAKGMQKGGMTLIDAARAEELYALMGPATEMSGGSAGNTMAAFASFGGKGAYIGKVANDQLGKVFRHDIRAIGVDFFTPPLENSAPTAQCLILVTPDAQRTMNTFLGACVKLGPADVDENLIANSEVTYLEGYLFDEPQAKEAFFAAARYVKKHNRKLALTLSDSFCVNRYRNEFLDLIENHVDILFANDEELKALFQVSSVEDGIQAVAPLCDLSAVTMSEQGSVIISGGQTISVKAVPPSELVDTTGAGDAYAAGFLYGLTEGKPLQECGHLASLAASEIISHMGPRPLLPLKDII